MEKFWKWLLMYLGILFFLAFPFSVVVAEEQTVFQNEVYRLDRLWSNIPNIFNICFEAGNFNQGDQVTLIYSVRMHNLDGSYSLLPGTNETGINFTSPPAADGSICQVVSLPDEYSWYQAENQNVLFLFRFVNTTPNPNVLKPNQKDAGIDNTILPLNNQYWYTNYLRNFALYKPIDITLKDCPQTGQQCQFTLSAAPISDPTEYYPNTLTFQFKDIDKNNTPYPLSLLLDNGVSVSNECLSTLISTLPVVLSNSSTGPDDLHGTVTVNPIKLPLSCRTQTLPISYLSSVWSCSGDQCVGDDIVHYACPKAYTWPNDPQTYYCGTGKDTGSLISYEVDFCPENKPKNGNPEAALAFSPIPTEVNNTIRLSSELRQYDELYGYADALKNCQVPIFNKGSSDKGPMYACAHLKKDGPWSCDLQGSKCDYVHPDNPTPGDGVLVQWDCHDIKDMFGTVPDWCSALMSNNTSTPLTSSVAGEKSSGITVTIKNYCAEEILVGYSGPTSLASGNPSKWNLNAYDSSQTPDFIQVDIPDSWTGTSLPDCDSIKDTNSCYAVPRCAWNTADNVCARVNGPRFWPRTGCKYDKVSNVAQCETGDCGGRYDCGQPSARQLANCASASDIQSCGKISGCTWYHDPANNGQLACVQSPLAGDGNISLVEMCFNCTPGMICLDACRSSDKPCQDAAKQGFKDHPESYKAFCPASCFSYKTNPNSYLCQEGDTKCANTVAACQSNGDWVSPVNFTAYDISLVDAVNTKIDVVPLNAPITPPVGAGVNPAFWCGTNLCSTDPIQSFFDVCGNTNVPLDVANINNTQGYLLYNDQTPMFLPGDPRNPIACFSNCGQTRYPSQPGDSSSSRYQKWNKYCCQNEWTKNPACCHAWYSGRTDVKVHVDNQTANMLNNFGCCIGPLCTWPFGQPIVCNNSTLFPTEKDKETCMQSDCCSASLMGTTYCLMMPPDQSNKTPNGYASCDLDTGAGAKNIIWLGDLTETATQGTQGWDVNIAWQQAKASDQPNAAINYTAMLENGSEQNGVCDTSTPPCHVLFTIPYGDQQTYTAVVQAGASGYVPVNKEVTFTLGSSPAGLKWTGNTVDASGTTRKGTISWSPATTGDPNEDKKIEYKVTFEYHGNTYIPPECGTPGQTSCEPTWTAPGAPAVTYNLSITASYNGTTLAPLTGSITLIPSGSTFQWTGSTVDASGTTRKGTISWSPATTGDPNEDKKIQYTVTFEYHGNTYIPPECGTSGQTSCEPTWAAPGAPAVTYNLSISASYNGTTLAPLTGSITLIPSGSTFQWTGSTVDASGTTRKGTISWSPATTGDPNEDKKIQYTVTFEYHGNTYIPPECGTPGQTSCEPIWAAPGAPAVTYNLSITASYNGATLVPLKGSITLLP